MKLSSSEVKIKAKEIFKRYKDDQYIKNIEDKQPKQYDSVYWSKSLAYTPAPLTLEFVGFSASKYLSKKPTNKDFEEHYLVGDEVFKVISYKDNVIKNIEYISVENNLKLSVLIKENELSDITEVYYENNIPVSSLRVDDDGKYWYHEYIYEGLKIKKVLCEQTGYGRGTAYVEYVDNIVNRIYHVTNGVRYYHYRRK